MARGLLRKVVLIGVSWIILGSSFLLLNYSVRENCELAEKDMYTTAKFMGNAVLVVFATCAFVIGHVGAFWWLPSVQNYRPRVSEPAGHEFYVYDHAYPLYGHINQINEDVEMTASTQMTEETTVGNTSFTGETEV